MNQVSAGVLIRNAKDVRLSVVKTNWGKQRLSFHTVKDWNSLPLDTRNCTTIAHFRSNYLAITEPVMLARSCLYIHHFQVLPAGLFSNLFTTNARFVYKLVLKFFKTVFLHGQVR